MSTWMWGGNGIHSLESVRAKWEVGWGKKLALEGKSICGISKESFPDCLVVGTVG